MADSEEKVIYQPVNGAFDFDYSDTVGAAGTAIYGGFIDEEERNSELTGANKYRTYTSNLKNIGIVSASTFLLLDLVSRARWSVQPSDSSQQAQEIADLIDDMMHDMRTPWRRCIRRAAMFRTYGFSVQEFTTKRRDDGWWGVKDVAPRSQESIERWVTTYSGEVLGVIQRAPQDSREIPIPRDKMVYVVDDSMNDSPEGAGIFRHIAMSCKRLQYYLELEGFGYETDMRGIPVGRGPFAEMSQMVNQGRLSQKERVAAEAPIRDFVKNHIKNPKLGLLLDSDVYNSVGGETQQPSTVPKWDMKLLDGGSPDQESIAVAIEREKRDIAIQFGTEGILLGSGGSANRALAEDKSHSLGQAVDAILKDVRDAYQKDFVHRLMLINGWPSDLEPILKHEAVQFRSPSEITGVLTDLAQAGVVLSQDDPAINEVRELVGLSDVPDDQIEGLILDGMIPNFDQDQPETSEDEGQ